MKGYSTKVLKAITREALDAYKCNDLATLVKQFSRALVVLKSQMIAIDEDNTWLTTHSICILFSTRIKELVYASMTDAEKYESSRDTLNRILLLLNKGRDVIVS